MLSRAKLSESPLEDARPNHSIERAPEWVERTNKILPVASCSPVDQVARPSKPLFWSSRPSNGSLDAVFTLQVFGVVSMLLIHNFNGLNVGENDDVLEFEQCVSDSNIARIECMRFCDKQITLSTISMFVGENNAIK